MIKKEAPQGAFLMPAIAFRSVADEIHRTGKSRQYSANQAQLEKLLKVTLVYLICFVLTNQYRYNNFIRSIGDLIKKGT